MITRKVYKIGFQPDVVSDFYTKIHKNCKEDPKCEMLEFNDSEITLSLLKVDNTTKAFVIEHKTGSDELEFILCDIEVNNNNIHYTGLFKMLLKQWFDNNEYNHLQFQIHKIEVTLNSNDEIEANITLGRPGLLIGKAGRTILDLIEYMNRVIDKKVVINILEFDPWN